MEAAKKGEQTANEANISLKNKNSKIFDEVCVYMEKLSELDINKPKGLKIMSAYRQPQIAKFD